MLTGTAHSLCSPVLPQNGQSATCSALPLGQPCWVSLQNTTTTRLAPSEPPDTAHLTQNLPPIGPKIPEILGSSDLKGRTTLPGWIIALKCWVKWFSSLFSSQITRSVTVRMQSRMESGARPALLDSTTDGVGAGRSCSRS